ncbi:MAG: hypothetical protein HKN68_10300, partial [Saprospiraceae bacterium]|nr:hypothetical protein [Saprospiraceae bacterium]
MNIEKYFLIILILMLMCCNSPGIGDDQSSLCRQFPDVLNYTGIPSDSSDRSVYIFSDRGAWQGYALPDSIHLGSFVGPFLMTMKNGSWLSTCLSKIVLRDNDSKSMINLDEAVIIEKSSYPDQLLQKILVKDLNIELISRLTFLSNRSAIIHIEIENLDESEEKDLNVSWEGSRMLKESSFSFFNNQVQILFNDREHRGLIQWSNSDVQATISDSTYHLDEGSIIIPNGGKWSTTITHTFCFSTEEMEQELHLLKDALNNPQKTFDINEEIWDEKISRTLRVINPQFNSNSYHRIAVKCLQTLNNNWRSKAGFLEHDGLFPSYNYEWFHGFWAWDSWKHAVAIAHYDEELAKEQIRA